MKRVRVEWLLPLSCAIGAVMLIVAEFADTFEYRAGATTLSVSHGGGRHGYAFLVLGIFALIALVLAVADGSRPAAIAVAAAGAVAILLFLLIDVPDAGATGTFAGFVQGKAHPEGGFWLELVGGIVLLIGGATLAIQTKAPRVTGSKQPATMRGRA